LERLSSQWLGVLQEDFYGRMIGMLVENVLLEAMKPVLAADCITTTAASEIYRIFKIIQRSRSLLPDGSGNEREMVAISLENIGSKNMCPSYNKFCALTDILEFKLNDIANGQNRKRFADFTVAEIVRLVTALFEDSPRRQTLLAAIEAVPVK
jgi:centromere/kinetochore protein ZW10